MSSKRRAITTMRYVAADLGLDVRGGLFRQTHAEGRFNGVDLQVTLVSGNDAAPAGSKRGSFGGSDWFVQASSSHHSLGGGIRIRPATVLPSERDQDTLVLTDDRAFDEAIHVSAVDRNHAHRLLAPGTRSVILAFFESGVEAEITDEQIEIMPQVTARALSSRLRNAARMSRLLEERLAELS